MWLFQHFIFDCVDLAKLIGHIHTSRLRFNLFLGQRFKGHCNPEPANALFPIYQQPNSSCLETCVLWAQSKYVSASVIRKTLQF